MFLKTHCNWWILDNYSFTFCNQMHWMKSCPSDEHIRRHASSGGDFHSLQPTQGPFWSALRPTVSVPLGQTGNPHTNTCTVDTHTLLHLLKGLITVFTDTDMYFPAERGRANKMKRQGGRITRDMRSAHFVSVSLCFTNWIKLHKIPTKNTSVLILLTISSLHSG